MNDIIIIGGGLSGLYCYYKLEQKYKNIKISLFEKNKYFGGRILTQKLIINNNNVNIEAGAGRLNLNHKLLINLLKDLDLKKDLIKLDNNVEHLETKNYKMDKKILKNNSYDYINKVLKKALKEKKEILINITFYEYAKKVLNKNELKFMLDFSGYYGELFYENAYDSIKLFKEGIRNDINYYGLKNGFSSIIQELIKKIKNKKLYLNSTLLNFYKKNNIYILNINGYIYQTKALILALPKPSLLNLNYFSNYFNELNSINCKELCRIYTIFPNNWFQDLNKFTSNNKLRYVIPIDKNNGVIMTSYTDSKYAQYWNKFIKLPQRELNKVIINEFNKVLPDKIPQPINNIICYWNCGVSYWKPKIDSSIMSEKILRLNNNDNVFIIGENYSNNQGWCEGALDSVEKLLYKFNFIN